MKKVLKSTNTIIILIGVFFCSCKSSAPEAYGPAPTPQQLAWQQMEMNMFVHFGPNTFTGLEWGTGQEPEDIFNPTDLNCGQWARTAKSAGFKGIILTAKHHDGFCLWPNPVSKHTVRECSWRDGNGDVLKELSEACANENLKFGIYISPWDRHDPNYGTPNYNDVFLQTLQSALSNYGPIFEQWFDGACGEGPNGKKQTYDWPKFFDKVRELQPDAIMFSNIGPGCRWVGNEDGHAGETCWSTITIDSFSPSNSPSIDILNSGERNGKSWVPAETDISLHDGWFYRESENPKSVSQLLNIYYNSVGRNSLLLLNVPPDTRGQIAKKDSLRLMEFKAALEHIFSKNLAKGASVKANHKRGFGNTFSAKNILNNNYHSYWTTNDDQTEATLTVTLPEKRTFNRVMIQEYIPLGQRIESFEVQAKLENGQWKTIGRGTSVGYKRILLTEEISTNQLKIVITKSSACPIINGFGLFYDDLLEQK